MANVDAGVGEGASDLGNGQVVFVEESMAPVTGDESERFEFAEPIVGQSRNGEKLLAAVRGRTPDRVGGIGWGRTLGGLVDDAADGLRGNAARGICGGPGCGPRGAGRRMRGLGRRFDGPCILTGVGWFIGTLGDDVFDTSGRLARQTFGWGVEAILDDP